jgi:small-conductance mechanosensitive channel
MEEILTRTYFDNTVRDYLISAGIVLGGIIALRLFKRVFLKRMYAWAEKTETNLDDIITKVLERFGLPLLSYLVIYWGLNYLVLSARVQRVVEIATGVVITFFILRLISSSIQIILQTHIRKQEGGEEKIKQIGGIMIILNLIIWTVGSLALFDNLGYDVTTIIAGLGIGGIAIALAAQNILGDLFNYFVIFFDRPFEIGDFIVVDDKKGTVEYIGVKTTRLKSLSGEQLIVSNSDLTKSRLHNFKRMDRRRILFRFGVVYGTKPEHLQEIPEIVREIIQSQPATTLDRVHFAAFGSYSLDYEIVYFVENPEYNVYMDIQQTINIRIYREFKKRGIEFALSTQTVISKDLTQPSTETNNTTTS